MHSSFRGIRFPGIQLFSNQWWTICDTDWDDNDGMVVCKQLGYPFALKSRTNSFYGERTRPIGLGHFKCSGSESRLEDCIFKASTQANCSHNGVAGVKCGK